MLAADVTVTLTVADVYGRGLESLATHLGRRQQFTEFRVIGREEQGVTFLGINNQIVQHQPNDPQRRHGGPRLIVKTRPNRVFTYTETDEVRVPEVGTPYLSNDGKVAFGVEGMTEAFPILGMTMQEVA